MCRSRVNQMLLLTQRAYNPFVLGVSDQLVAMLWRYT